MAPDDGDVRSESFNPWSVVHLVFQHLSEQGLHPALGGSESPGVHAAALLHALHIEPAPEGNREEVRALRDHLAELRRVLLEEASRGETASHRLRGEIRAENRARPSSRPAHPRREAS